MMALTHPGGELLDLTYLTAKEREILARVIENDIALRKESFWYEMLALIVASQL